MDVVTQSRPPVAVVFANPLDMSERTVHAPRLGQEIFDWLQEEYPDGFGRAITLVLNGEELDVHESDIPFKADDVLAVMVNPGDPISGVLLTALISAVVSIAATFIVSLIFGKPKGRNGAPEPDPVYSLSGGANSARLGEPIPVGYGKFLQFPDYVCPPYSYFEGNDQYIVQLLCIGQGEYEVDEVLISDTPDSALNPSVMRTDIFPPGRHSQAMGNVETQFGEPSMERVITSIEVSDIELSGQIEQASGSLPQYLYIQAGDVDATAGTYTVTQGSLTGVSVGSSIFISLSTSSYYSGRIQAINGQVITLNPTTGLADLTARPATITLYGAGDTVDNKAGPFIVSLPGFDGEEIQCDFVFPSGLFEVDEKDGSLQPATVKITVTCEQIDVNNVPTGLVVTSTLSVTRSTNTPQRITHKINATTNPTFVTGRYRVKVERNQTAANSRLTNNMAWVGLKTVLVKTPPTQKVYGETTLVAVKLRASSGISSDAANRIRVRATRRLSKYGQGHLLPTRSPADAFTDIITNPIYGAARGMDEVDVSRLKSLETYWGAEGKFDGIFNTRSTVWEALQLVCQPVVCIPALSGKHVTMIQDGKRAFATQVFSPANIAAGGFRASYGFDKVGDFKGVSVEYRDEATFQPAYAVYPDGARRLPTQQPTDAPPIEPVELENLTLFGCTDKDIAEKFAKLVWQRRLYQRTKVEVETELEGMLPQIGDRIIIANDVTEWGEGGEVVSWDLVSSTLLLDRDVDWTFYTNPTIVLRDERGQPTAPINVSKGATNREAVLASAPTINIASASSNGAMVMWVLGDTQKKPKEITLMSIEPRGEGIVALQGTEYDSNVWFETLDFLAGDVPQ